MRLVMIRKPPGAAERSRRRARRDGRSARRRGSDPRTLAGAGFLILLTSLGRRAWTARRLGRLYGVRWQVELAIKRMKSLLRIDGLRARDPALARAWLYAHLLFALLAEDAADGTGAQPP